MNENANALGAGGFNDRDPSEEFLPITEEQEREFVKHVVYWSGASDDSETAQAGDVSDAMEAYIRTTAPHRLGTDLARASTRRSVRYERGDMAVTCTSTGDSSSLLVEERTSQADSNLDEITRTEYVTDDQGKEVVRHSWLIDRETGEPIDGSVEDLDDFFTFDEEHAADITIPEDQDATPSFTRGEFWDAQDIFTMLEEEGWQPSYPLVTAAV